MKIKSYQCKLKMKIKNVTLFTHEIQHMVCSNMSELERREKLHTLVPPKEIQESANRIMSCYICGEDTIPSITDKVYAMGKAIEKKDRDTCR